MPRLRRLPLRVITTCSLGSLVACHDQAGRLTGAPTSPPDISQYVTGAAAAALDENGFFAAANPAPRERPVIAAAQATAMAMAHVRDFAEFMEPHWEKEHGGDIDIGALRPSSRVHYAESAFGAFPDGRYHPAFPRFFGPYYVVALMDGSRPVLLVAVSAYGMYVDEAGSVDQPRAGGGEFERVVVPRRGREYAVLSPEHAVERIGRATGARVAEVPELLIRWRHSPALGVWKLTLDRPVRVRGPERRRTRLVRTIYVDPSGQTLVPKAAQPAAESLHVPVAPPWDAGVRRTLPAGVPVVPGRAVGYDVVKVQSAQ